MFDGSDTAGVPTEVFFVFAMALGVGCYAPPLVGTPACAAEVSGPLLQCRACLSLKLSNGSKLDHDLYGAAQLLPHVQKLKAPIVDRGDAGQSGRSQVN